MDRQRVRECLPRAAPFRYGALAVCSSDLVKAPAAGSRSKAAHRVNRLRVILDDELVAEFTLEP